jgi:glycosyltransferase involved in cell wall biosynthesis
MLIGRALKLPGDIMELLKGLSVCMIARDEEPIIARAIANALQFADEIILVDTGSIDNTRSITQGLGARTFYFEWINDFSAARNESLRYAKHEWIMWMDADDIVPEDSVKKIIELKSVARNEFYGFTLRNILPVNKDFVGGETCIQSRMFRNVAGLRFQNRLHEQATKSAIELGLSMVSRADIAIEHHGYKDEAHVQKKLIRNIRLMMIGFGFPAEADILHFKILNYNCFYFPSVLMVWENHRYIGLCDPFDAGIPETLDEQNNKLNERAILIISEWERKKVAFPRTAYSDEYDVLTEEIARIGNAAGVPV